MLKVRVSATTKTPPREAVPQNNNSNNKNGNNKDTGETPVGLMGKMPRPLFNRVLFDLTVERSFTDAQAWRRPVRGFRRSS